ncbi:class I SAM-dependent DNA methyltransferase [Janibacter corallicola]|uniref:class I SAM-dependent DNA methyltransferase n=1 Tax=Janibacter corallicola TaxID=415212 RepID=UPI0008370A33|nr:methyltransferase domain-containing protein [Janibacter corallicola]
MATEHFDEKAATWDDDGDKERQSGEIARGITAAASPAGGDRLLEYGAGTGLVTQALLEATPGLLVTLADNSTGMREAIGNKVEAGALPPDTRVWDLDLESDPVPEDRFELIVTSMVMHHVKELETVLRGFATMLEPGGHLCIADLDHEDGSFHDHDFEGHHGFHRSEVEASLTAAGLVEVHIGDGTSIEREDGTYPVFLAVATRPSD